MTRLWINGLYYFTLCGLLAATGFAYGKTPQISTIRIAEHPDKVRLVIEIDQKVSCSVFTLPDPCRIVVDLPEASFKATPASSKRGGYITGYRFGLFSQNTSRFVIDINRPVKLIQNFVLPPREDTHHRIVIDMAPATQDEFIAQSRDLLSKRPKPQILTAPAPLLIKKPHHGKLSKKTIVIDAGHGGVDPGCISRNGIQEKDITLAMAKILKAHLEHSGRFHVVLTRDRDIFITLQDRVRICRQKGGDLFVSLHADAAANLQAQGCSFYTLSDTASDQESAALAAKENKADIISGIDLRDSSADVSNILIDLAQRDTMNLSTKFAGCLVSSFRPSIRMKDIPHRKAGFAVLKAPDVPAVLIELGYLTNVYDERLLSQHTHRQKIANVITHAIDRYYAEQKT